jgi:serine/threonine protein kinase
MTEMSRLSELSLRWEELRQQGLDVTAEDLCHDCPELAPALRARIEALEPMDWMNRARRPAGEADGSTDTPPATGPALCLGAEVAAGYRLIERQGRGTFGEVWAAQRLGRLVAVKLIHGSLDVSQPRLRAEAELEGLARIKRVSHPHVLEILGAEVSGTSLLVITELADRSLKQHFEALPADCTALHRSVHALYLLWGVAEALDHLRQHHDLMHLDVKPANLLLVSGECKLADFGTVKRMRAGGTAPGDVLLACRPGPDAELARTTARYRRRDIPWQEAMHPAATLYTAAGAFTPYYASPEMFQGRASSSSDQYSLALTFCHLVAGNIPFRGEAEAQTSQRQEGRLDLDLLPEPFRPVVARALSPRPNDRFPSCVDFIEALEGALTPDVRLHFHRADLLPRRGAGTAPLGPSPPGEKDLASKAARRRRRAAARRATASTSAGGAKPKARPRRHPAATVAGVLVVAALFPLATLSWAAGLLRRLFWPGAEDPRATQRVEYRLVCALLLLIAPVPALLLYWWVDRVAPITASSDRGKERQQDRVPAPAPESLPGNRLP